MRVDGTEESRVTDGTCNCETPVFSPNGLYIAYTKWPIDSTGSSDFSQVCYIGLDGGSVEVALHDADAVRENPCWSPDCQYIIYQKTVESNALGPNKEKQKQIGRARTRIRSFDGVQALSGIPRAFALYQNRPNPFGRATTIRYAIPVPSFTELNIYDVAGRTVTRLVQSEQRPGYYSVAWKGTDARGRSVAAGTYFYVLKSNGKIAQKRMLLVRWQSQHPVYSRGRPSLPRLHLTRQGRGRPLALGCGSGELPPFGTLGKAGASLPHSKVER